MNPTIAHRLRLFLTVSLALVGDGDSPLGSGNSGLAPAQLESCVAGMTADLGITEPAGAPAVGAAAELLPRPAGD